MLDQNWMVKNNKKNKGKAGKPKEDVNFGNTSIQVADKNLGSFPTADVHTLDSTLALHNTDQRGTEYKYNRVRGHPARSGLLGVAGPVAVQY